MRLALESSPAISVAQVAVPPSGSTVGPGDRITYALTLTNSGTADLNRVVLTDTLPTGVEYVPSSASAASGLNVAAIPPPALVFTGALPAGGVLTATFCVTVSTVPSGTLLINTVKVVTDSTSPVSSTVAHPVAVFPGLSITKTATPSNSSPVELGDWITYTVVAYNGGGPAHDMILSDTLDLTNVTLVMSHTTDGVVSGPSPVRVTGLDLGSGQRVTLTLGVTVTGRVSGTVIRNRASVTSTESTTPSFSDVVTHVISYTEILPPSFVLTKTAEPPGGSLVELGETITYTIVAHNQGGPATDLYLVDAIPVGTAYVSGSGTANLGTISLDGVQVRLSLPSLPAGELLTATFCVTVTTSVSTTLTNVAMLDSVETEPEYSNRVDHRVGWEDSYWLYLPVLFRTRVARFALREPLLLR
jgi:uncharacterized repeat protein (TIGR01451 family)